jgi:hypothetical protein
LYHVNLARIGFIKCYFDDDILLPSVKVPHPQNLIFDKSLDADEPLPWIGEYKTDTAKELIELFPKKEKEIISFVNNKLETPITYLEFWTEEVLFYKMGKIILHKEKNPYWQEEENYLSRLKVPYIPIVLSDLGEGMLSSTTIVEQAIPLQDGLNNRKNQIDRNANIMNGKIIASGDGISKANFESIDWTDPEVGIFMDRGDINAIKRESGQPLPAFIESDMYHSITEIDNVMGAHSSSRGERTGRETAKGREILKDSDRGRIDLMSRRLEEVLQEVFRIWVQIIKIKMKGQDTIQDVDPNGNRISLNYSGKTIDKGIDIIVLTGSMTPDDKANKIKRATDLATIRAIPFVDLYRELGYPNPEEMANRMLLQETNPQALIEQTAQSAGGNQEQSIMQAQQENAAMLKGSAVPPYQKVDQYHLAEHEIIIRNPQFKGQPIEVKKLFIQHIKDETVLLEKNQVDKTQSSSLTTNKQLNATR